MYPPPLSHASRTAEKTGTGPMGRRRITRDRVTQARAFACGMAVLVVAGGTAAGLTARHQSDTSPALLGARQNLAQATAGISRLAGIVADKGTADAGANGGQHRNRGDSSTIATFWPTCGCDLEELIDHKRMEPPAPVATTRERLVKSGTALQPSTSFNPTVPNEQGNAGGDDVHAGDDTTAPESQDQPHGQDGRTPGLNSEAGEGASGDPGADGGATGDSDTEGRAPGNGDVGSGDDSGTGGDTGDGDDSEVPLPALGMPLNDHATPPDDS
jgi:hypothetical protein